MRTRLFLSIPIGVLLCAQSVAAQYYRETDLVSDERTTANPPDPHLVNAWGLVSSATSPWWVANNGTLTSTLYDGGGVARALVVTIPGPPTGIVFNGGAGFVVHSGASAAPARFIFATEDGKIAGWAPTVPAPGSTQATVAVDNSAAGSVYKGLAIASTAAGAFLYATDFHNGAVDVFNSAFVRVNVPGAFTDRSLPAGYAPFGIQTIGARVFVTYALQDADAHDDVAGVGHGFVDAYDTAGNLLQRVASKGRLNSPWGLALAPATFGAFGGALLVGNFGDGKINAFDLATARGTGEAVQLGQLHSANGAPLKIDGLWALQFGHGNASSGSTNTLYFTAGPDGESHGLFGKIEPAPAPE
ncbi:MAG TPA: TIGR03118 family protein [Myxococcales bacterium]|jgi:uncharacterized protein (TIGR03118 family)|nr:TIGR03118 family protein [Myxococcales bacterium]